MAFQSVPGAAIAEVIWVSAGVTLQNTFYGHRAGGYDSANIALLAERVDEFIASEWLPLLSNTIAYVGTTVTGLQFENDVQYTETAGAGNGGLSLTAAPLNVTFAIKRTSGLTGRSARGRIYWPQINILDTQTDRNYLQSTIAADMVLAVSAIRGATIAAEWTPVIVSRFSGGEKRETGVVFSWEQTGFTDLRLDSRRDRLPLS